MIRDLGIENLGVIAATRMEFASGLTVLTGETGAGKTLITTALSLLLGGKADATLIRHGAVEASVECTIALPAADAALHARLDELGACVDEGDLIATRTVGTRSRALLGGRAVASAVLNEVLGELVTVHGQHGQVRLTRSVEQRQLLDAADPAIADALPIARTAWQNLRDARARLDAALQASVQDEELLARLRSLLEDVATVAPMPGEDAALDARIARVSAAEAIERATRTALAMLIDGDSIDTTDATSIVFQARRLLEPHALDPRIESWVATLASTGEVLSRVGHELTAFVDELDADETDLDELMSRRAAIGALLRRWGCDLPTLLERVDQASRTLALAADPESQLVEMRALLAQCERELDAVCSHLHDLRVRTADSLAARVAQELHALGLPHAVFEIAVERAGSPTALGDDAVEFRFTANPGQPPQALARVGSGGELSRVMLALETVATDTRGHTFVFDEVDAGVGGRAALEVGRRLTALARQSQVIVVTHLAQVAAFADRHLVVEKSVVDGQTRTEARHLNTDERVRELTRLLSGVEESVAAQTHALELLDLADQLRAGAA